MGGSGGDTADAAALDGISTRTGESVGLINLFKTVIDDSPVSDGSIVLKKRKVCFCGKNSLCYLRSKFYTRAACKVF